MSYFSTKTILYLVNNFSLMSECEKMFEKILPCYYYYMYPFLLKIIFTFLNFHELQQNLCEIIWSKNSLHEINKNI